MGIVIKGGTIVTAVDSYKADIRIEDEKVQAIGYNLGNSNDEVVYADGCYILPGAIDPHTHFDLDVGTTVTADDFRSGTKAAIIGGTTTIIDFATQNKGETLKEGLHNWHKKAQEKCYCDYGFHMAVTDWNEKTSCEMEDMIKEGICSFKMYMAYKNVLQVDDSAIFKALKRSCEIGALIGFHCENGDIIDTLVKEAKALGNTAPKYHPLTRPVEAEEEAISRVTKLAEMADAPVYIVHLSSKKGMDAVMKAKMKGVEVYTETCPQYLLLNDSCYEDNLEDSFNAAKYVMSPPLRKTEDQNALWNAIFNKQIDTIATDHCSFNYEGQKTIGKEDFSKIPNGGPGVEHRLQVLYTNGVETGKIDLNELVALTSTNAAKLFGLFPKKGTIAVGSDADIVVFDPNSSWIISAEKQAQRVDYTPYEGFNQKGKILHVFLRGEQVVKDSKILEKVPSGKYLFRKPFMRRRVQNV